MGAPTGDPAGDPTRAERARAPAVFVTGTDTGVGKTRFAAALVATLRATGARVGVLKPAETGWPGEGTTDGTDGALLREAAGALEELDAVVPHRFAEPLAPAVAAARAGRVLDVDDLVRRTLDKRARFDAVIVEGAGGLLVPLAPGVRTVELITHLAVPTVVVAANRLGAVNHTLLTVERLRAEGLPLLGVVLNHPAPPAGLAARTNPGTLAGLLGDAYLGELGYDARPEAWRGGLPTEGLDAGPILAHLAPATGG